MLQWSRKASWTWRIFCLLFITVGPLWIAREWQDPKWAFILYDEVGAGHPSLEAYLAARPATIDSLLPDGAGGTRYYVDLDGNGGMAAPSASAIALNVGRDAVPMYGLDLVEIHERGHLLHAAVPDLVDRLVARLPPPDPAVYASTSHGEHFSEMLSSAWEIIRPIEALVCVDVVDTVERLEQLERQVPGTAGALAWFLSVPDIAPEHLGHTDDLRAAALALSAETRDIWEAIQHAVDARRRPDNTLEPLPPLSVSAYLTHRRRTAHTSHRWYERTVAWLLWPSTTLASLAK